MFVENNPFTPSFGRVPPYMAGRSKLLNDYSRAFSGNGNDPCLQSIVTGARGTGKTAFITRVCEIASSRGWICASTTCAQGMLDDVYQQAVYAASNLIDNGPKSKIKGLTIGQLIGVEWELGTESPANWRMRMVKIIEALEETGTGLVIAVDEVRPSIPEMEQLAGIFQHFVSEGRRVALVMAGLPHQVSQLVNSDAVSFLRRATMVTLGSVDDDEIADAMARTFEGAGKQVDQKALDECVAAVAGFPYMMQLVGFRAWDASGENASVSLEDAQCGVALANGDLERQVIAPTWASLSEGDREFCRSVAKGNVDAKAIAQDMGKKPNYVSKYKQRALEQGVVSQDMYGRLSFGLPGLEEFIERESNGR